MVIFYGKCFIKVGVAAIYDYCFIEFLPGAINLINLLNIDMAKFMPLCNEAKLE